VVLFDFSAALMDDDFDNSGLHQGCSTPEVNPSLTMPQTKRTLLHYKETVSLPEISFMSEDNNMHNKAKM
jgi:hypothetical protein